MPQPIPILVVGLLGVVLFVAAGVMGWRGDGPDAVPRHLLVALAATLAWLFSQTWVLVYGVSAHRPALAAGAAIGEAERLRRAAWLWPVGSTALVAATFTTGAPVFTRAVPSAVHLALAVGAALVQLVALGREFTLLSHHRRVLRALAGDRFPAGSA